MSTTKLAEALRQLIAEYGQQVASMRVDSPRRVAWRNAVEALASYEAQAEAKPAEPSTDRVEVDAAALRRVLVALNGQGHEIRELQVLRGSLWPDSPIDKLTGEFNAWVKANDGFAKKDDSNG